MQHDSDLIIDLWARIKPHVSPKERIDVADQIVAVFDEYGKTDGLEELTDSLDMILGAAVKSRYGLDSVDEEYEENDYYEN